jgi:hypothetical protein
MTPCDLYCLLNVTRESTSRRLRGTGHVAGMRETGNSVRINLKKTTISSISLKWTYNINLHIEELGINVIWIYVSSDWDTWRRLVNT